MILFDRLIYIDRLKQAGIADNHARAHADAVNEALRESVATRHDLEILKRDLTIRNGGMLIALFAALVGIKYFG
jgi:hypothetical protein